MISQKKDNYILLRDEKDDAVKFADFIGSIHHQFENDNLVIDLLKYDQLQLNELLAYLDISNHHRSSKKSFVIVNDTINIDEVPEELNLVPTLVEAQDMVNMEELERELGF